MKYWASNFAIIPIETGLSTADPGIAWEKDWISPGITSWGLCREHPRNLFLQLLMGSLLLIAAYQPAQAEALHSYIGAPAIYGHGAHSPSKLAPHPAKSNIKHQTSNIKNASKQEVLGEKCEVKARNQPPSSSYRVDFQPPIPASCVSTGLPSVASDFQIPTSHFQLPTSDFPLPTSNGALLAHQTTSITKPLPAARNGVAISTPLPEARDIKKMINHFQICTQGYSASPGIPIPASGLYNQPLEPIGVKVEKCKSVKDGQQECSEFGVRYSQIIENRNTIPLQHRNTATPQHHNTTPPLHPPPKTGEP